MRASLLCCLVFALIFVSLPLFTDAKLVSGFRPRATPLFVLSPAMAFWLKADNLTDRTPELWYHQSMSMTAYARIDGVTYRWLGVDAVNGAKVNVTATPPMTQTDLVVTPTRTIATFAAAGITLTAAFWQPAFADDLEYYARQFAYITTSVVSSDGAAHRVQMYIDQASDVPVNQLGDNFVWADWSSKMAPVNPAAVVLQMNDWQAISFQVRGDEVKPNWGDVILATQSPLLSGYSQSNATVSRNAFINGAPTPQSEILPPRAANNNWLVSAFTFDYGAVAATPVSSFVVFLHNEAHSVAFFHNYQVPYWKHIFGSWQNMLQTAFQEHEATWKRAIVYDDAVIAATTAIAGDEYATITALIHRQVMGATLLTWNEQAGRVDGWMKEQSTDGDVSTVDVVFPGIAVLYILSAGSATRYALAADGLREQRDVHPV